MSSSEADPWTLLYLLLSFPGCPPSRAKSTVRAWPISPRQELHLRTDHGAWTSVGAAVLGARCAMVALGRSLDCLARREDWRGRLKMDWAP
uniref:Uncharacterized protein n=1 Tax=Zea mays TaxID=4577 RepID=A0A804RHR2_MAIZE